MKYILLIPALLVLTTNSKAQTIYPSGVTNCIARWDFLSQGTITTLPDVSLNNHSGTATNLTTAVGFKNRSNEAMHFDGNSSYALVNHDTSLNPAKISIVALVKPTGFYSGNCQENNIIYKSISYHTPGCWSMKITDNVYDNSCSTFSPNNEQLDFAGSSVITSNVPASNYIQSNNWYFLALTYDGDTLKRYQVLMNPIVHVTNITPISTQVLGMTLGNNTNDVVIGKTQNSSFPYYFNGDMDELALFNKDITDAEVQSIYDYLWGTQTSVAETKFKESDVVVNISNGILNTKVSNRNQPYALAVYTVTGQLLYQGKEQNAIKAIDLSAYPNQVLMVKVQSGEFSVTKKVVKL